MALFDNMSLDPGSLVGSIVGTVGNAVQARKNREQQEKWNQIQMQREDTAIQRRMADYAAAGINPLMAVGSSGAESGNYNAPQANVDYTSLSEGFNNAITAKTQKQQQKINDEKIKQEKDTTLFLQNQHNLSLDMARAQLKSQEMFNNYQLMDFLNQSGVNYGLDVGLSTNTVTGETGYTYRVKPDVNFFGSKYQKTNMPMFNNFLNQNTILANQSAMSLNNLLLSNKDVKWDTANRALNFITGITGAYSDILSPFNFNKSNIHRY